MAMWVSMNALQLQLAVVQNPHMEGEHSLKILKNLGRTMDTCLVMRLCARI